MAAYDAISFGLRVLGSAVPLVTLWLRLHFRLRQERERRDYLQAATALPAGSRVREQREDGTRLVLDVGPATRNEC
ncbi:hypothetical protein EDC02_3826 [Micromonospora sp. Llam0]|uniref:hypothetical protein n=1 Tax=Micromonospora sp. Llam0 TaxID=2485143 RepID=UPI000F491285|nr:hypothetical protein [Micromonospora sp. Llam0]ROO61866.1 hypothetical protein EDC02_3826 [Micromonospora sp. Llam0]